RHRPLGDPQGLADAGPEAAGRRRDGGLRGGWPDRRDRGPPARLLPLRQGAAARPRDGRSGDRLRLPRQLPGRRLEGARPARLRLDPLPARRPPGRRTRPPPPDRGLRPGQDPDAAGARPADVSELEIGAGLVSARVLAPGLLAISEPHYRLT